VSTITLLLTDTLSSVPAFVKVRHSERNLALMLLYMKPTYLNICQIVHVLCAFRGANWRTKYSGLSSYPYLKTV